MRYKKSNFCIKSQHYDIKSQLYGEKSKFWDKKQITRKKRQNFETKSWHFDFVLLSDFLSHKIDFSWILFGSCFLYFRCQLLCRLGLTSSYENKIITCTLIWTNFLVRSVEEWLPQDFRGCVRLCGCGMILMHVSLSADGLSMT